MNNENLSDEDAAEFAAAAGLDIETARENLERGVQQIAALGGEEVPEVVLHGEPLRVSRCQSQKFRFGIKSLFLIDGEVRMCGPKDKWTSSCTFNGYLANVPFAKHTMTATYKRVEDNWTWKAGAFATVNIAYGVKIDGMCAYLKGSVQCWPSKPHAFHTTIKCFGDL